jgi:hypothetical protein
MGFLFVELGRRDEQCVVVLKFEIVPFLFSNDGAYWVYLVIGGHLCVSAAKARIFHG